MTKEENLQVKLLIAPPASGKSTFANNFIRNNDGWVVVNRDSFRYMLQNKGFLDPKGEDLVTKLQNEAILTALDMKYNVIVDNTNLKAKHIEAICELVKYKADVEFVYLECSIEKCLERDKNRERSVGEDVIKRMFNDLKILLDSFNFQKRKKVSPYERTKELMLQAKSKNTSNPNAENCIIFDIDGTLALMGNRDPFDWHLVDRDFVNEIVKEHIHLWKSSWGHKIILLSGRDEESMQSTKDWLDFYGIAYDKIFMRKNGDRRKDSIVKLELYNEHIKNNYNVVMVYDDRNQVVDMWRSLGITCFQVADGRF